MEIDLSFLGFDPIRIDPLAWINQLTAETLNVQLMMYVSVFVGALLAFEGLRQLLSRSEQRSEARNRRMRMMHAGRSTEDILAVLKPERNQGVLGNLPIVGDLRATMSKAGLTMPPALFVALSIIGMIVFGVAAATVLGPVVAVPLAVALFGALPLILVRAACQRRMDQFVRQLPDALELMARGLKVGHPLNTTIRSVATEMPDPIASEFGVVMDQIAYGDDLTDAFREMADRIDLEDVRYLSVSIGIQHGAGGDLARVLMTLGRVIRNRLSMRRRIRAISSEGRLSAYFLSVIPVVIFVFTSVTAPSYYGDVMDDPLFPPIAVAVVILVVLNAIVLRRLVNFRI
ncbi:type II secretion system F family protein [Sulfitobacter sp. D35]|uniref:type II secretion system F family protein n=1 Tax=Sulfitobacter sp. D35 TaxID=3083252 RepID=UPI00296F1E9B|nr:type II secretion system F family protein [Sulfitobacter sp. D35]MDW4499976.1 type II secretion system F family protein [Sulfitobacter sp. D35]